VTLKIDVLLVFPHPDTIFGPAEERKWEINKRRHWQQRNNYTLLYPIYINKRSQDAREREGALTVMFKIIFQGMARHVLKHVYGCERVLHCRWNIWFSLARPVSHSAELMQSVYPSVTLTIHLWPTARQHQKLNKLSVQHHWWIYFHTPQRSVPTCCLIIIKRHDFHQGFT